MPKKGKKGKTGKSKGKKGKGGKKGKKSGSDVKKSKEENISKLATTNSNIWETRLESVDKAKNEYREAANLLANQNSEMRDLVVKSEKDTVEVVIYWRQKLTIAENEVTKLKEELMELASDHKREKQAIIIDMSDQIAKLEEVVKEKTNDILLLKNELKMVNEFRKKRNKLNQEFTELKEALHESNKEHQDVIGKMEKKFFEEKVRLQLEASKKISELADRAHKEAINNLDEATRSIFKENVRANEALKVHIQNTESQREKVKKLKTLNQDLTADKEMLDRMVNEKIIENKKLTNEAKDLKSKVDILEKALTQSVKEYDASNKELRLLHENEMDSLNKEIEKLQRLLDLRTTEIKKIRSLAKSVVSEKTEIEKFFLESLEMVKQEIASNQNQYKKDAQMAYQQKMMLAHQGKGDYPAVRTFNRNVTSTNNVYKDLEAAVKFFNTTGKVDISDLTWEQRERVIRYLFAKINTATMPKNIPENNACQSLVIADETFLPPLKGLPNSQQDYKQDFFNSGDYEIDDSIFVTQGISTEST